MKPEDLADTRPPHLRAAPPEARMSTPEHARTLAEIRALAEAFGAPPPVAGRPAVEVVGDGRYAPPDVIGAMRRDGLASVLASGDGPEGAWAVVYFAEATPELVAELVEALDVARKARGPLGA